MVAKKQSKKKPQTIFIDGEEFDLPHEYRRSLFKLSYQIDLEYWDLSRFTAGEDGQPANFDLLKSQLSVEVSKLQDERSSAMGPGMTKPLEYADRHIPLFLRQIVEWLYLMEGQGYMLWKDSGQKIFRQRRIDILNRLSDKWIRDRMDGAKAGAPEKQNRPDFQAEREAFRDLFVSSVQLRMQKKQSLTFAGIAETFAAKVKNSGLKDATAYYARWSNWASGEGYRDRGSKMKSAAKNLGFDVDELLTEVKANVSNE